MSLTAETLFRRLDGPLPPTPEPTSDRRADVEAKQARVSALLREVGCEGLLVLEPENFAWLTSGGTARGTHDAGELPALYFSPEQRWIIASNVDTQRLFDEEVEELGFQLKEWPWHWGRAQLLADLCASRTFASDRPLENAKVVADTLVGMRRMLTAYEQACFLAVGQTVSHTLEATCRTMEPGLTEREIAGQLGHRLLHRGVQPVSLGVAADGRSRAYRQFGFTATPIEKYAVLTVTGRKYGLCVTASRTVCFGPPDDPLKKEHDAACKVCATYLASSWPDAVPREILKAGRLVYQICGYEHEWLLAPAGYVTGRLPVEFGLRPDTEELFQGGWAVTWTATCGAALSCDSFVLNEEGPQTVTPIEIWDTPARTWPQKRIRVQGAEFFRPDLLVR